MDRIIVHVPWDRYNDALKHIQELPYIRIVPQKKKDLSGEEKRLINYLLRGVTVEEIAKRMRISPRAVADWKTEMLKKIDLDNPAKLIYYAIKHHGYQIQTPRTPRKIRLSKNEGKFLQAIVSGKDEAQTAKALKLPEKNVNIIKIRLMTKAGVKTDLQLLLCALENELIETTFIK